MHLDEDAFALWQAALRSTTTIEGVNGAPGLIDLVPLIVQQLSSNLDVLGTIVHIVESYILLDGPRILQVRILNLCAPTESERSRCRCVQLTCCGRSMPP